MHLVMKPLSFIISADLKIARVVLCQMTLTLDLYTGRYGTHQTIMKSLLDCLSLEVRYHCELLHGNHQKRKARSRHIRVATTEMGFF